MNPTSDTAEPAAKLSATYPSIARRLAAMMYEALLVAAILMVAAFLFYGAATGKLEGGVRIVFQCYLVTILATYFVWCWRRGRTLAMKAWKLRLVRADGTPLSLAQALLRFLLAALSIGAAAIGAITLYKSPHAPGAWIALAAGVIAVAWAVFDRDRQFLHDRLAGTRLVLVKNER